MKKNKPLLLILLLGITLLTAWKFSPATLLSKETAHSFLTDSSSQEKDILPQILALNADDQYSPKKDFRTGHVTTGKIDNYLTKTPDGFCIQLPSKTNIPTPAVINGRVYLSGGFGSRQYYSFDAETGENKWAINLDDDGPSSPAIEDGVIVFNTES